MKTILVNDNSTGKLTVCVSNKHIKYDEVIDSLEISAPGIEDLSKVRDIILSTLHDIGFYEQHDVIEPKYCDMTIRIIDNLDMFCCETRTYVKCIVVGKLTGNCIDKFVAHNMYTFSANILNNFDIIRKGKTQRCVATNYHDSDVFETDFATLSRIRKECERMADKIRRLQENLTNASYTS